MVGVKSKFLQVGTNHAAKVVAREGVKSSSHSGFGPGSTAKPTCIVGGGGGEENRGLQKKKKP